MYIILLIFGIWMESAIVIREFVNPTLWSLLPLPVAVINLNVFDLEHS